MLSSKARLSTVDPEGKQEVWVPLIISFMWFSRLLREETFPLCEGLMVDGGEEEEEEELVCREETTAYVFIHIFSQVTSK